MNSLQIPASLSLDYLGQAVRTVMRDGQPWFAATDLCEILEIKQATRAVEPLDEDERGVITTHTLGGPQQLLAVNESGLYALIFQSRKPAARAFRKWVTNEVLPALRKQGYVALAGAGVALAEWGLQRAQMRRRLTKALALLDRDPQPGVEYLSLVEFLAQSGEGATADAGVKCRWARAAEVEARAAGLLPIARPGSERLRPGCLWPRPVLERVRSRLATPAQLTP